MKNTRKLLSALLVIVMMLTTAAFAAPAQDRAGNDIAIPAEVNRIISLAPATTQIIESLGMMDKLVAVDTQTPLYVEGTSELPQFDMMAPDVEQIAALEAQLRTCLDMLAKIRCSEAPAEAAQEDKSPEAQTADEISQNLEALVGTTEDTAPKAEPKHPTGETTSKFTNLQFGKNYNPNN